MNLPEFDADDFIAGLRGLSKEKYLNEGLQKSVSQYQTLKARTDSILEAGISDSNYLDADNLNTELNEAFVFCCNQNLEEDYNRIFDLQLRLCKAMHGFAESKANKICDEEDRHLLRYLIASKEIIDNEDREKIINHLINKGMVYLADDDEYCLVGLHSSSNGPDFDDDDDESYQTQLQAYLFDSDRYYNLLKKHDLNRLPVNYTIIEDYSTEGGKHLLMLNCSSKDTSYVKNTFSLQ